MTLLVTGGGGFAMSHVARLWLERHPEERVVVLDRAPLDEAAQHFFAPVAERLRFVETDLSAIKYWSHAIAAEEITAVVHGAAVTSINRLTAEGLLGAQVAFDANVMGCFRLLGWASRLDSVSAFINVSSGSVYSGEAPEGPLPEEGYVAPEGLYPISKHVGELLTLQAAEQFGLPAVSVRLSGVYGPMDRVTDTRDVACLPQQLARLALSGETIRVNSLSAIGDFIHAGDVATGICALLEAPQRRHQVYNIGFGEATSVQDLLDCLVRVVPSALYEVVEAAEANVLVEPDKRLGRWGPYDISRLTAETGWQPRPLAEAIADYVAWLREEQQRPV